MVAARKRKAPRQKPRSKRTARRTARQTAGERIDQLVALQQAAIQRHADLCSNAASRFAAGDLNLSRWAKDYSTFWSNAAEDVSNATRIVLRTKDRQAKSNGQRTSALSDDVFRNWLSLHGSFLLHAANYYRNVGELVEKGSMDPREWFQGGAEFWSGVVADIADWARLQSGVELRPTEAWTPRVQMKVRQGKLADYIDIDVPVEAFPKDQAEITLFTDGFTRVGGGVTLKPGQHIAFNPQTVRRSSPRSRVQLHSLSGSLAPGQVYAGVVWAEETKYPVAAVEIEIV